LRTEMKIQKKNEAYAKGRREEKTICSLKDQEGRSITSFEGLANLG